MEFIKRSWSGCKVNGEQQDRFANAVGARVANEIAPVGDFLPVLVDNWLEVADRLYREAGEPVDWSEVHRAADEADISDLYDMACPA